MFAPSTRDYRPSASFGLGAIYQSHLTSSWSQSGNRPVRGRETADSTPNQAALRGLLRLGEPGGQRWMSSAVATLVTPAFDAPFPIVDVFALGPKWADSHNHVIVQSWVP